MVIKTLPVLYKKTSTGAIQQWEISVLVNDSNIHVIKTVWGQVNGKMQETEEEVLEGKNIGKKNETTPEEQALSQMQSDWEKRKKKGYVESIEDAEIGVTDDIIEGGVFPMLAHVFDKQKKKIKYPALAQPKLDGHRCVGEKEGEDEVGWTKMPYTLWSRTRKPITGLPHIQKALGAATLPYLDGELYNHEYKDDFEELTSFIRQDEAKEGCEIVQYHVYDIPCDDLNNYERYLILEGLRPHFEGTPIHIVETRIVKNEEELMQAYVDFMDMGYEGAMVRNWDGMYKYKRSHDLQKVKQFDDSEFEIVEVKVGTKGKMKGLAIFVCYLPEIDDTFDCKMKGKLEDLKQYADNPELAIGKQLTVQYQGFTKYGKPRFPVGLRFREDL